MPMLADFDQVTIPAKNESLQGEREGDKKRAAYIRRNKALKHDSN